MASVWFELVAVEGMYPAFGGETASEELPKLKPTGFRPIYLALGSIVFLVTLAIMLLAVLGKPGDESD